MTKLNKIKSRLLFLYHLIARTKEVRLLDIDVEAMQLPQIGNFNGRPAFCLGDGFKDGFLRYGKEGIRVRPILFVPKGFSGNLFFTQLCISHEMKLGYVLGGEPGFLKLDRPHHDGSHDGHDNIFTIDESSVNDLRICFKDTPLWELTESWNALDYAISFDTYIQVNDHNSPADSFRNLGKFSWNINATIIKRDDKWVIVKKSSQSKDDVYRTFTKLNGKGINPLDYPNLECEVLRRFNM